MAAARGGQAPATARFSRFHEQKSNIRAGLFFVIFLIERQQNEDNFIWKNIFERKKPAEQIKAAASLGKKFKLWEGKIPVSCSRIFHVSWEFTAYQIQRVSFLCKLQKIVKK